MGSLRKTASIATLGLISFRSKNERLAKAGAERDEAVAERVTAQRGKDQQSARADTAERRARRSERRARGAGRTTRRERKRAKRVALSTLQDASDAAVVVGWRARRKLKRQARKVEKAARGAVS